MLEEFNGVLGILKESEEVVSKEIESLINEREEARKVKDYKKADRIRTILLEKGIILEDTSEGTYWKRKL
jgi:cysteinyl-tRNA synthetase